MPDAPAPAEPALDRDELDRLVEAAAARDRDAFAALFNFYAPRVKAYLLRLNAGDTLAEELTQEVMLTVWRKAGQFDRTQASASTWIFRIARNRRIDAARRAARPALDETDPALQPEPCAPPDEMAHAAARDARVRKALEDLPGEQVELLRLAFFDGLSHRDIAERLGAPLGTVKSRLRLAFDKLRRVLDPDTL
ncbi:sigma-70 family RNA polymerase sigma factor [Alkalicaulis satelles]|uniref:RNA polymerase sigma factor n=1 Tax=Alkalicaulis satelles TaxID=2609175 RepID=A0A5M6ZP69_9PROT|nr:sigma-70 family RNA polymerase sigma factor [Alkalicaulis satelles]KAA5804011.1 sigma-70 family RNA polymerase sigma factor [Alkalicaulis satelles]